jgi:hypothetical protein
MRFEIQNGESAGPPPVAERKRSDRKEKERGTNPM